MEAGSIASSDLRPGTYAVRFTLPGFKTAERAGIELSGTFTAPANAQLKRALLKRL